MRSGPITGSIGESWPLFVPFDDDPASCPLGISHGAGCQNFVTVGLSVIVMTWSSWRCVIRDTRNGRSGAGQMWRAYHLPGPCSRSAHAQPPPVPRLDGLAGPALSRICARRAWCLDDPLGCRGVMGRLMGGVGPDLPP
jgi:hypothetical protein